MVIKNMLKIKRNRREGCENGLVNDIVMSPFFGTYYEYNLK